MFETCNAFDARTEAAVQPFAEHAAEVIGTSPLYAYSLDMVEDLVESLEDQTIIAQASGVIISTEHRTAEEAMHRLGILALASGQSMRTVADWVIAERASSRLARGARRRGIGLAAGEIPPRGVARPSTGRRSSPASEFAIC